MNLRVTGSNAATSEATKFSLLPTPITTGQPARARIMLSRRIFGNDGERIGAFQLGDRGAHRAENVAQLLLVVSECDAR